MTDQHTEAQIASVAYHEAGHAVMAMALGVCVVKVDIEQVGNRLGCVVYQHTLQEQVLLTNNDPEFTRVVCLILVGGIASDFTRWKLLPDHQEDEELLGHWNDQEKVRQHLSNIGLNGEKNFRAYILAALALLQKATIWPLVEEVARILLARRALSREEIADLTQRCPRENGLLIAKAAEMMVEAENI